MVSVNGTTSGGYGGNGAGDKAANRILNEQDPQKRAAYAKAVTRKAIAKCFEVHTGDEATKAYYKQLKNLNGQSEANSVTTLSFTA